MTATILWLAFVAMSIAAGSIQVYYLGKRAGREEMEAHPELSEMNELRRRLLIADAENKIAMTREGRDEVLLVRERARIASQLRHIARSSTGPIVRLVRQLEAWLAAGAPDDRGGDHG